MKTIQKIWQHIYSNWLFVIITFVLLTHFYFKSSWMWLCLPAGLFALTFSAAHFRNTFFSPLRVILWPVVRFNLIKKLTVKDGNIFNYPMITWVEYNARTPWIRGGWFELSKAMAVEIDDISTNLKSGLAKLARAEAMAED